jgi:curli biogenesis system outer membrane secretion channel CsgG
MKTLALGLAVAIACGWACNTRAQDETAPQGGGLRYSITVSTFENKSGWHGQWEIGNAFGEIMTKALHASGKFIVLGEPDMRQAAMAEQDLGASGRTAGGAKTAKVGRLTPAQLLVKGAITHVQNETAGAGGGLSFRGIRVGGSGGKGEVNATIYLVDAETGQVKASTDVVGVSTKKGLNIGYSGGALGGLGGDLGGFLKDNVGKATENAVAQAVEFLAAQLEKVPWTGSIAATGSKIIINRGTREGVAPGMEFQVGKSEQVVDPDTGEVLDTSMTKAGVIRVVEVKEKVSYCEAVEGADAIQKGMTIMPK